MARSQLGYRTTVTAPAPPALSTITYQQLKRRLLPSSVYHSSDKQYTDGKKGALYDGEAM